MNAIKLGIVGCGIAVKELHYPALMELQDLFKVEGVTSRTEESADACAKLFKTRSYAYDDLLDRVDAVDIAVPTHLNYEMIKKALDAKVNVICEKPIAENVDTGKKIVELARGSEAILYIAENYRHSAVYAKAKEVMEKIGKPEFVLYSKFQHMEKDVKYAATEWRKNPKHIGGFLSDGGVHDIAALRMVMGNIIRAKAFVSRARDYLGSYDTMSASLLFANGALGTYSVSYGLAGENIFCISGTEGFMKIQRDRRTIEVITEKEGKELSVEEESIEEENTYKKEFIDFYEVVNGKENSLGSPAEALEDLRVIEEAIKSSEL